jgi:hypothetical protein
MSYPHREVSIVVTVDSQVPAEVKGRVVAMVVSWLQEIGTVAVAETPRDYAKPSFPTCIKGDLYRGGR